MGNGSNRSGDGLEQGSSSSSLSLDCDVGLGLKMQNTESYPHLPYHHHHPLPDPHTPTSSSFNSSYGGRGGPVSFGTYDDAVGAAGSVLQRTLHPFTSDTSFKSSGPNSLSLSSTTLYIACCIFFSYIIIIFLVWLQGKSFLQRLSGKSLKDRP